MSNVQACSRCLFDSTFAKIMDDGTCEYCHLHNQLEAKSDPKQLTRIVEKIKRKGKKQYDCLIGISGGMDSSLLLYWAVQQGLRPLVIHFDNGYNSPEAEYNMKAVTNYLGVNVIIYRPDMVEYDMLNRAFLFSGTPDMDIPNDIAMTKLMYSTAAKYGIKYILNGHCFRTEGSTPKDWTYMDGKYIESVYKKHASMELRNYPNFTFWDQIRYSLKGIKQVRPFHYMSNSYRADWTKTLNFYVPLKQYGGKHAENLYTEFIGSYMLPNKFGIDKRIVYLSARVRSGLISRVRAKQEFETVAPFKMNKFSPEQRLRLPANIPMEIGDRSMYERYNFKKYKWLIWLLMKMGTVPRTFYVKYCK